MTLLSQLTAIVRTLVLNTEARVRVGWRLFVCLLLCSIGWAVGGFVYASVFDGIVEDVAQIVVFVVVIVFSVSVTAKYLDRRQLTDFGFHIDREWALDLLGGLLIGALIPIVVLAVYLGTGWASVEGILIEPAERPLPIILLTGIFITSCISVGEELLYRGYILQNLVDGFQWMTPRIAVVAAWVGSAVFFTLPHANLIDVWYEVLYYWVVGMVLALPVVLRGELAMALGLHTTYNYWTFYVLGKGASGLNAGPALLTVEYGDAGVWFESNGMIETIVVLSAVPLILAWGWWREEEIPSIQPHTSTRNTADQTE